MPPREKILFDPKKVRFDLPILEAFGLTWVRSLEDYRSLKSNLDSLRGASYFFINCLDDKVRLMITIITAESDEVTATFSLDHDILGISHEDLICAASGKSGNFQTSHDIEQKLRDALVIDEWRFFNSE